MKPIIQELTDKILQPKKAHFVDELIKVVLGKQPLFIPYRLSPQYFEIWFYLPFDFNYVFLGNQNYVINLSWPDDQTQTEQILDQYRIEERAGWQIRKDAEFAFFIDSWREMEKIINQTRRCFLIEYGVFRGIDVNRGSLIEGDEIEEILRKENITWR
jgi:hypothetical protein